MWKGGHVATQAGPKPLSARSVVVSLLLGAHPEGMTARRLVAAGEHFGLPSATVRAALSRAVAAGDLRRAGSTHHLGERLLRRRERQELHASQVAWDGAWEVVVVVAGGRPSAERASLRAGLGELRLAELREGVWMRPDNLARPLPLAAEPGGDVQVLSARPTGDPAELAARLWDLDGWAQAAEDALALLAATTDPAERLAVAALLVRHLTADPLLPPALQPAGWPAARARAAYAAYEREIAATSRR